MFKELILMTTVTNFFKKRIVHLCKNEEWFKNDFDFYYLAKGTVDPETLSDHLEFINQQLMKSVICFYIKSEGYLDKLKLRNKQLIYRDHYGDLIESDWEKEVNLFTKNRILKIQTYLDLKIPAALKAEMERSPSWNEFYGDNFNFIVKTIKEYVEKEVDYDRCENTENVEEYDDEVAQNFNIDPYEYEKLIAEIFENLGWTTFNTPKSGDQGADIVMQKEGFTYVVQCKLYGQPVGNKAVQEVSSAKAYYEAVGSVVVTNNDYTKSARQLAESQNVWLLHDSQLVEWNSLVDEIIAKVKESVNE